MNWLNNTFGTLLESPLIQSILILFGFVLLAKITDLVFTRIFKRLVAKTKTNFDDKIIDLLHKPIFYSIIFIGFTFAFKRIDLPDYLDFALVSVVKTITILIWLVVLTRIFILTMDWLSTRTASRLLQHKTLPLFNNLGKIVIAILGIYFIFLSWNINVNGLMASGAALSLVLGFAAKDTVANFFSGFFLLADSPFKEGDYILLDTGERGYVKNMGLRSTRIMTRDDIEITLPNSVIASSKIVNESGGPAEIERVRITLTISYGSDIDEVKELLISIAKNNSNVMDEPEPRVRFREFVESGLKLQLLFWIYKPEKRGRTVDQINTDIYKKFNERNILIPYPTMKVILPKQEMG